MNESQKVYLPNDNPLIIQEHQISSVMLKICKVGVSRNFPLWKPRAIRSGSKTRPFSSFLIPSALKLSHPSTEKSPNKNKCDKVIKISLVKQAKNFSIAMRLSCDSFCLAKRFVLQWNQWLFVLAPQQRTIS